MSRKLKPVSPGEMLAEEFLRPLCMSNYRLAKEIGVPAQRIGEIIAGKRAITADTDLRLCRFFGLSDGWWLRLQADYDTGVAKAALAKTTSQSTFGRLRSFTLRSHPTVFSQPKAGSMRGRACRLMA